MKNFFYIENLHFVVQYLFNTYYFNMKGEIMHIQVAKFPTPIIQNIKHTQVAKFPTFLIQNIKRIASKISANSATLSRILKVSTSSQQLKTTQSSSIKIPIKINLISLHRGETKLLLSEFNQPSLPSTRSIHTVFNLQQNMIDSAALALSNLGGDPTTLKHLSRQLEAAHFKADRPATPDELKATKSLSKNLINLIANQLRKIGISHKEAMKEAKFAFSEASKQHLNHKKWATLETQFEHGGRMYHCTSIPAAQMKLGTEDIFPTSYQDYGVCSKSTQETIHSVNMWVSDIRVKNENGQEQTLFKGLRHGVLSPFTLEKGTIERLDGAKARASEVVTAALFTKTDLLQQALKGETVELQLVSTSLLTAFQQESDMLHDQIEAWKALCAEKPLTLSIRTEDGHMQNVKVKLNVAAFNFGVNELALKLPLGHNQADKCNVTALHQLLGNDLHPMAEPGGWVGEYLANNPKNATRVRLLSQQLKEIWADKTHHYDGGEPYKAPQRVAMLAYEIGAIPCWNCKSGKDRTGMLDVELKREAVAIHQGQGLNAPGSQLKKTDQKLLQQLLLHSGNLEIQAINTGAPGNKVMKNVPLIGLSYKQRIGDSETWEQAQGLSSLL
ncbi:type III secretion system effector inositol phosphate phosphatase [Photorhabdus heterorhabditis]|nr:type III secretion system effector inositol phosphate phosphatase [Photorhabdus heterorhabditis]